MTPLLDYWLKVNLFLLLFYGCYWLLLRRHTFLTLNRTYLLGSIGLALVLPAVHVPGLAFPWPWETSEPVYAVAMADAVTVVGNVPDEADAPLLPDWPVLAQWLFALVAAGMLGRTGWQTGTLLRQIRQWPGQAFTDHTLVLPATDQLPTFSFFRYLVLNPADTQASAVRQHELVHIRQRHTVDVLLLEVLHAFCWPNPVLFGYRRAIRQVHEFLADRDAVAQTADHRDVYARFLVDYAFHLPESGTAADALAHSFGPDHPNSPTLKQRIQMLYQQHTHRRALWKYALVLPLATALLAMTTEPEPSEATTEEAVLADHIVHVHGIVSDSLQRPLPGVTISVRDKASGTTTDAQGAYDLDVPAGSVLITQLINFESQEMLVVGEAGDSNLFRTTLMPRGSKGQTTRAAISQNFTPRPDAPATDAYPVSVSGRVSGPDGKPVSGAGVSVKGSQTGTFADAYGKFQINAPASAVLLVSSAGFAPQEIVVMDKPVMAVSVVMAGQVKRRSAATASLVHVEGVISGNNKPLPNANIIVQNGTSGTTTDLRGHFQIKVPSGTALIVRASGFRAQKIDINPEDGDQVIVDLAMIPQVAASTPPRSTTAPLPPKTSQGDEVFTVVQQQPMFPGGMGKLFAFVNKNLRYPAVARQANVSGKVFVAFIVSTDGRIERPEILKGIGSGCDEEAIRLVKSMPNWIPGKQSGRAVAVKYNLPIHFQLVNGKKAKVYPSADPTGQKSALMNDDTKNPKKETIQISVSAGSSNKGLSIKGVKEPLYFLDGKEVEAAAIGPDQLNVDLVQTIDVLKDEAARAQYGERGRNGVVRITTKAGAQKKE